MEILIIAGLTIVAYLIGSFSSAVWYGRWFYNMDIREHGSKNAGSTNVLRVFGWKCAILVFITDVLKSFLPAMFFVKLLPEVEPLSETYYLFQLLFGMFSIIGHIFPLYTNFKGGKGVASMLGLVMALDPISAVLSLSVFIIVVLVTRIVSVSSMLAGISFPIIVYVLNGTSSITLTVFSLIAAMLLLITHKKNIKRLLNREEPKITIGKKE